MVAWTDFDYQVKVSDIEDAFGLLFRARSAQEGYMWQLNFTGPETLLRPHVFTGTGMRILPGVKLGAVDPAKEHLFRIETRGAETRTFLDGKLVDTRVDGTFASGTVGVRTSAKERASVSELSVKAPDGTPLLFDRFRGHILPAFRKPVTKDDRLYLDERSFLHEGALPKTCPRFRKTFTLAAKPVRHAFVSVCGYGFYELSVNGEKADPRRVLAPGMTDTNVRLLFDTYDVTPLLAAGPNTLGLRMAAGYSDDFSRYGWHWLREKSAILRLAVTYADGTRDTVVSDGSWSFNPASEITRASIYGGETIDHAWTDAPWTPAITRPRSAFPGRLLANDAPPVRKSDPRRPVRVVETNPGVYTADFGQNRAGFVEVRVKGPRGARIGIRTSELLGADGSIDPWSNGGAESRDEFILAGADSTETFCPSFTYHGFRYVEITGWPGRPTADDLTAWAVHADVESLCSFRCSDETLNRLDGAARWSMLSNFMSYPTDCAMRTERTPCQMDSQAYEDTALLYFNLSRYYAKWLTDIGGGEGGNPDWDGDATTLPWRLWRETGDRRLLETRYALAKRSVDVRVAAHPDLLFLTGFGDWCAPNDGTWKGYFNDEGIVNTGIFCEMVRIVADSAAALGRTEDEKLYRALSLHGRACAAFQAKFYHPGTRTYGDGSQTTSVIPLAFGIVPADLRAGVIDRLLTRIRVADRGKIDTGIFGTRYLGDVLCDAGASDLLVDLFTQPEYPGFGFMFANGATTLWEQWNYRGA